MWMINATTNPTWSSSLYGSLGLNVCLKHTGHACWGFNSRSKERLTEMGLKPTISEDTSNLLTTWAIWTGAKESFSEVFSNFGDPAFIVNWVDILRTFDRSSENAVFVLRFLHSISSSSPQFLLSNPPQKLKIRKAGIELGPLKTQELYYNTLCYLSSWGSWVFLRYFYPSSQQAQVTLRNSLGEEELCGICYWFTLICLAAMYTRS